MNKNEIMKIGSVKNKISLFAQENDALIHKLKDYNETLKLNYEVLKKTFLSFGGEENIINDLVIKGKNIFDNYDKLIQKRKETQKNIFLLRKNLEDNSIKINIGIENYSKANEKLTKEIDLKDIEIKKLKAELKKLREKAFFKEARTEIKVCPPNKINVLINQEIITEKNIIKKAMDIHSAKEKISKKLKLKYNSLYDELKKESIEKNVEIKEKEILTEETESEESEDDDIEEEENKQKKVKEDIDKFKEKYKNLQDQYESYKKRIMKYKQDYKYYKEKIAYLKNHFH